MLANSVYCHRQYQNDIPQSTSEALNKIGRCVTAALPLFIHDPILRTPISTSLGVIRNITHLHGIYSAIKAGNYPIASLKSFQLLICLAALSLCVTSIALPYFNPSIGLIAFGVDDIISNIHEIAKAIAEKDLKQAIENLIQLASSVLFIAFLTAGHIEILVTCLLVQIALTCHKVADELKKGNFAEAFLHLLAGYVLIEKVVPQIKVTHWKASKKDFKCEGTLQRAKNGFIYLKVDDKYIYELNELFGDSDIPPYFGKGKVGAHITVIKDQKQANLTDTTPIPELGQKMGFTISFVDSLKPGHFAGVSRVSFIAVRSPKLEAFRAKYGLTPKVSGNHDFHITFGVNYSSPKENQVKQKAALDAS